MAAWQPLHLLLPPKEKLLILNSALLLSKSSLDTAGRRGTNTQREQITLSILKVNEGGHSSDLQPELLPQPHAEQLFLSSISQPALPEVKSLTLGGHFLSATPQQMLLLKQQILKECSEMVTPVCRCCY